MKPLLNSKRRRLPIQPIVSTRFLRQVASVLLHDQNEDGILITGPHLKRFRIFSEFVKIEASVRTPTYYEANPISMLNALCRFLDDGHIMDCWAHCHPFAEGPIATTPSSLDFGYLESLQDRGSDAIGLIVSKNLHGTKAWFRFFSIYVPFEVHIYGSGCNAVKGEKFTYELAIRTSENNQDEGHQIGRPAIVRP